MRLFLGVLLLIISSSVILEAQEKFTISGYVRDFASGEALISATIQIPEASAGAYSNPYGFYSITVPAGTYTLKASYVGYEKFEKTIELNSNIKLDIELKESNYTSEEIVVSAVAEDENVKSIEMSSFELNQQTIKSVPALLGEVDVVKSIQLLPGVTTVGEGATGFNVRGGAIDQNLILLDESPVYNSSHLFGFFSVFNPDAVKDVKLIKGGIPSQYGGRLSSILDVRLKEGNTKAINVDGGVGAIFSRLAIEGPIVKDKASFLIAARRSYIDVLARPFLDEGLADSDFYFYDLTAKANWQIDDKNTVFASGYFGRDVFGAGFGFNWGSQTATARWNHLFSDKLFSNLTYYYSNYDYALQFGDDDQDLFKWSSNIITQSLKYDFEYFIGNNNSLAFGLEGIYYDFVPGNASGISDGLRVDISLPDQYAGQLSGYIGHEFDFNELLSFKYGLRGSFYSYLGPGTAFQYGDTTVGIQKPLISREEFGDFENISDYFYLEPRFSTKYQLTASSSVKASYNRMVQYVHLLSNTAASSPLDIWVPTTNNIKPQIADQIALGYFLNLDDNKWETSVEVFYKDLQNQIEYRNGSDLLLNQFVESDLLYGDGRAYGLELYIKKKTGRFNGWISYTLSRSEILVDGLNNDEWFPSIFDRTHNLTVVGFYDLTDKWQVSTNFVLSSGTPATFPTNRFEWQGYFIPHNSEENRNNFRIPAYHRLDLSFTYKPFQEQDDWWEGNWVFSIYNLYNRRNPFSVFFRNNEDNFAQTEAVRLAVFGSIVPSVSYNFNFDVQQLIDGKKWEK